MCDCTAVLNEELLQQLRLSEGQLLFGWANVVLIPCFAVLYSTIPLAEQSRYNIL